LSVASAPSGRAAARTPPTPRRKRRPAHARAHGLAFADAARALLCPLCDRDRRLRDRLERCRPDRRLAAAVWLPEASADALRRRVRRHSAAAIETAPAGEVAAIVAAIVRLLAGEPVGFDGATLDLDHTDAFDARVYAATRAIRAGQVRTYGDVAAQLGASARAVGRSLGRNPWPIVVPCHRVVAAGNALGGFSAPGGTSTKQRLLAIERARRGGAPDLFDALAAEPSAALSTAPSDGQAAGGR
jgi:methylated-DNA-[protein]-cysteine S-methyltransferase